MVRQLDPDGDESHCAGIDIDRICRYCTHRDGQQGGLASGEASSLVNASVGLSDSAGPMVTDAAPTISRIVHDRNSPPSEANSPVRAVDTVAGRYRV